MSEGETSRGNVHAVYSPTSSQLTPVHSSEMTFDDRPRSDGHQRRCW